MKRKPKPKRFWTGKKRLAKKYWGSSRAWHILHEFGMPKVGDLTHDCDGENHVITRIEMGGQRQPECYYVQNGFECSVCECGGCGFQPPLPREEVVAYLRDWDTEEGRELAKAWKMTDLLTLLDRLQTEGDAAVFDARGVRKSE